MFFNKFVNLLKPYKVASHKAWERSHESDVLKLDWNESTIPPSPYVADAIHTFTEKGHMNWYPDVDNSELRQLIADYSGVNYQQVEYFGSSDALHEYIIRAFINSGDTITMVAPTYDNFRAASESVGANIDFFELDSLNNFYFCFDSFECHLERVLPKIVYLCNPNNPTGTVYDVDLLEKLVRRFNDVLFIVDEAYFEFVGITAAGLVSSFQNLIVCRTFSKAFGLASFRIGYAITSEHNIDGLKKIRNPKNISSFSQIAAISALKDVEYMNNYVNEVNATKKACVESLEKLGIEIFGSEGGNFILVRFGSQQSQVVSLLEDNNIFVRNYGHVNGMGAYTRITVGTKSQMKLFFEVLEQAYSL